MSHVRHTNSMGEHVRDISNQYAEHNAAMADETYDRNNWDHNDDRAPTRAEAEQQAYEDWLYDRNHGRHN